MLGFAAGSLGLGPELPRPARLLRPGRLHGPRRPGGGGALLGDLLAFLRGGRPSRVRVRARRRPAAHDRRLRRRLDPPRPRAGLARRVGPAPAAGSTSARSARDDANRAAYYDEPDGEPEVRALHEQDPPWPRTPSRPRTRRSKPRSRTRSYTSSTMWRPRRRPRDEAAAPPEDADEPTEELELTPMGNRRSAVTESDELDYRVPEPSLLKRSLRQPEPRRVEPGAGRQAARRDAGALRHRRAGGGHA